jgi:cytochrome c-type biogenesis protein CcmH/NrfG
MSRAQLVSILCIALPALAVVLWPLIRSRVPGAKPSAPPQHDRRLELLEEKTAAYRALKELTFDYEAGHLSEDDYRGLRDRYESRAAELLVALDKLGPAATKASRQPVATAPEAPPPSRGWTRHPATVVAGSVVLLVFGIVIGVGVNRFTVAEQPAMPPGGQTPPGSFGGGPVGPPTMAVDPGKPLPPSVLAGMLNAARQSLNEGRYSEAIAAYQAVLKRDPRNVDAMTHLGLIVAIGGHSDAALDTFEKAARIDGSYAPIYLYRGQVLYEVKQDYGGAVSAWQRYLSLVPAGEEHDRVAALVKDAQGKQRSR